VRRRNLQVEPYVLVARGRLCRLAHIAAADGPGTRAQPAGLFTLILESLLGLRREGEKLRYIRVCPQTGSRTGCITGTGRPSITSPCSRQPEASPLRVTIDLAVRCGSSAS